MILALAGWWWISIKRGPESQSHCRGSCSTWANFQRANHDPSHYHRTRIRKRRRRDRQTNRRSPGLEVVGPALDQRNRALAGVRVPRGGATRRETRPAIPPAPHVVYARQLRGKLKRAAAENGRYRLRPRGR